MRVLKRLSNIPRGFYRLLRDWIGPFIANYRFGRRYSHLRKQRKIVYVLLPPPGLSNVGDHAQVVAIRLWFRKHFPNLPVMECDKNEVYSCHRALHKLVRPDDLFFIHSGGNLGDRGMWSENGRRKIIMGFPDNHIISLPQTIYFSDTPQGRMEGESSKEIYSKHPHLTVMGRDAQSGAIAAQLFPNARTFAIPDFVLSLDKAGHFARGTTDNLLPRILLCLRKDPESALSSEEYAGMAGLLPYECEYFDTTLDHPIQADSREATLNQVVDLFSRFDAIVTDRYHGLIFAVLCKKPTVVLPTVDHKLTSAMDWFKDVPFVVLSKNVKEAPALVERVLQCNDWRTPDWNAEYFDSLPKRLGLWDSGSSS